MYNHPNGIPENDNDYFVPMPWPWTFQNFNQIDFCKPRPVEACGYEAKSRRKLQGLITQYFSLFTEIFCKFDYYMFPSIMVGVFKS